MAVVPYNNSGDNKKKQVAEMFDNISGKYDFLNHLLSFNIDRLWRKKAIRILRGYKPERILDIATGTGDFAIAASKLNPQSITGIDISQGMLEIGKQKVVKKKLGNIIDLQLGDSENISFNNGAFDAAICAFGVRNFEVLEKGLSEILHVLKEGGVFIILEFSKPTQTPFKQLYNFYFKNVLPLIGRLVSKDMSAYTYLPESVGAFPSGNNLMDVLRKIGFRDERLIPVTFGIATIYVATKPKK